MQIRTYNPEIDYEPLLTLLRDEQTFGGVVDEARDSAEKLAANPESILLAEQDGVLVGTVTLFENGRVAWLYRFAAQEAGEAEIRAALFAEAKARLQALGHTQILVYAPTGDAHFDNEYTNLGFAKGNDYTAYWCNA